MHIIRKLWGNVHDETVENDISDKFDTYILWQLGYNRDSDFFKKNLRNIGYTTIDVLDRMDVMQLLFQMVHNLEHTPWTLLNLNDVPESLSRLHENK